MQAVCGLGLLAPVGASQMNNDQLAANPLPRTPLYLTAKEVAARLRMHRSTLYRMIAAGQFPPPARIGLGRSGWPQSDIDTYLADCIAARGVLQ